MLYKIVWRLLSPIETMLQSDTIFGHLCWAISYQLGNERLEEFLKAMESPVLTLSSGFPAAHLPMPVLPVSEQDLSRGSISEARAYLAMVKQAKKNPWLPLEQWQARFRNYDHTGVILQTEAIRTLFRQDLQFHNRIDRNTGTTTKGGANLFAEEASFCEPGTEFESYLRTDYFSQEELTALFGFIQSSGFGKNKSTGKGQFEISLAPAELPETETANAWLLLSNMVPAATDPQDVSYSSLVKFGKLGGTYAVQKKSPFKKPLLLFTPGTVFKGPKPPVGCMVRAIHPDDDKVVQHAYAFCMGFHLKGD